MAIRFAMYRTYGFTDEQSAVGVLIALVARYAAVIAMPLIGLAAVVVTGQGSWTGLAWLLGLGSAFMVVMWLIIRVARKRIDGTCDRTVPATRGRLDHHQVPSNAACRPRTECGQVRCPDGIDDRDQRRSLLLSNLSWGLANALVMAMALRFSGLDRDAITSAGCSSRPA